jgi:hypothetical protein
MSRTVPFTKHVEISSALLETQQPPSLRGTVDALDTIHAYAVETFTEFQEVQVISGWIDEEGMPFSGGFVVHSLSRPTADQFDSGALLVCSGSLKGNSQEKITVLVCKDTQLLCCL